MNNDAFFTLHRELPREGPGSADDIYWALGKLPTPRSVLDAGCGPGEDLETLAMALPQSSIVGIDREPHFVEAAWIRTLSMGQRVNVFEGDMGEPGGVYDLIWCTGALYFLGVTEGLIMWLSCLADGGHVVFSEPCLMTDDEPQEVLDFWKSYPQITNLAGINERVVAAGYKMIAHRMIVDQPWANYYVPLQVRIDRLRRKKPLPELEKVLDEAQSEIDLWKRAQERIAYALVIVTPDV